ncbi:major facilitator superfamily domain-containing protein [Stachybotrys elegans]|uniref:Major facilitator superfamily domain-containing protein n=1 Tax=Stachybotrys elegans TaxID=80388 RepID=A0A8K0SLP6_9HYPO|nr:major facilitator superfamily domain-containing protein [Stachybotrys elegans]
MAQEDREALRSADSRGKSSMSDSNSDARQAEQEKGLEDVGESPPSEPRFNYPQGAQFWLLSSCIALMMFMTNLEIPVITTALVAITDDLGGFEDAGWTIASYLLGYVSVSVISAKLSDIFSRKLVFMVTIAIFIIFSAACAAAQTIIQLIVFRAFQGVGGGGCFALCNIMVIEIVPAEQYPQYVSNIAIVNALALVLGPILGGVISANTTWRWIFIINIPIALTPFVIAWFVMPNDFPYQGLPPGHPSAKPVGSSKLGRIDFPGTILILLATLGITSAFEQAGRSFPWRSAYVISLLTISGILWILLLLWERRITLYPKTEREPVLPWRFFINREMMGVLLNFFFLGGPTINTMFIIPLRFQVVYQTSGLTAGIRLLPFTGALPVGAFVASLLAGRLKVPAIFLILSGSILQVIGFALLSTIPTTLSVPSEIYGYEFISGMGCGINYALLFILIPHVSESIDHAVGMGAAGQLRMIGSTVVLAISTSIFNSHIRPRMEDILGSMPASSEWALSSSEAIGLLPQQVQGDIRQVLAEGFNWQILTLCISAALQIPAALMILRKQNIKV